VGGAPVSGGSGNLHGRQWEMVKTDDGQEFQMKMKGSRAQQRPVQKRNRRRLSSLCSRNGGGRRGVLGSYRAGSEEGSRRGADTRGASGNGTLHGTLRAREQGSWPVGPVGENSI
jgi:hypothetical protein